MSVFGYYGWKILDQKRRNYEKKKNDWEQRQAARRLHPEQSSETFAKPPKPERHAPTPPPVDTTIQPAKESSLQSLARLRPALVRGSREEMPAGSANRAGRDFLLVPTPMTWDEASVFAEQHGGHLATPPDLTDLVWMSEIEGKKSVECVWLGAARGYKDEWLFVDGAKWSANIPPRGAGSRASLTKLGLVHALPAATKLPFFIQWRRDGTNPGSLAAMLERTRKSLENHTPVYPAGTAVFGQRRYLLVMRPMPWHAALAIAERSGGHLAAATESTEAIWLEEYLKDQQAAGNIWLGAFRNKEGKWRWITAEPFPATTAARWPKGYSPSDLATRLAIGDDHRWIALPAQATAAGFFLEWSGDRDRIFKGEVDAAAAELKAVQGTATSDTPPRPSHPPAAPPPPPKPH